ncbi:MAG: hypothetical protein ABMA01_21485, partial [Chthoniobacteraceae bacterium]
ASVLGFRFVLDSAGAVLVQLYTGFVYEGPALVAGIRRRLDGTHPQQRGNSGHRRILAAKNGANG